MPTGNVYKFNRGKTGRINIGEDVRLHVGWDGARAVLTIQQKPRHVIALDREKDIDSEPSRDHDIA